MTATEKALAAILKNIGNVLNVLSAGSASELQWKYSIAKSNYFYGKAGEDVKEWLIEIDRMLEANNVTDGRKVVVKREFMLEVMVAAIHLKDVVADWFEADKGNINQYVDNNAESFIRWIKVRFTSDI